MRRIACDSHIVPMVHNGESVPLDVGRTRRLVTTKQRVALNARDKGCAVPNCSRSARWSDAHHIKSWLDGGATRWEPSPRETIERMAIDRDAFAAWIDGYERSWRSEGTEHLRTLFTEDAGYRHSPYEDPISGLPAIARDWEYGREGHDEVFTMTAEILAVDGNTGVARVAVIYGEPMTQDYLDLWVVHFGPDGRATLFEEWPFWPDQPWTARERG